MASQTAAKKAKTENRRPDGHQAKKSQATRLQIIEAAIRCLLKYGYVNTTMPRIAEEAGLSRGAMMHHYSNRLTVIQKLIEHLHEKRLKAFRRAVSSMPNVEKTSVHETLEAYWRQVNHPLFIAFQELAMAARTDPDLESILSPARKAFNDEWYSMAVDVFPDWGGGRENFDLALALCQNMLDGMAQNKLNGSLDEKMVPVILRTLEDQIRSLKHAKS